MKFQRFFFIAFFTILSCFLFASFNTPVQLNQNEPVFYHNDKACKIIGNETYIVFVEDSTNCDLIFAYSDNFNDFTNFVITEDVFIDQNTKPTLEIMPDGKIIVFYLKIQNDVKTLFQAVSENNGQSFSTEEIATDISAFSSYVTQDELYLCYEQVGKTPMNFFQYFTEKEETENAANGPQSARTRFWGNDVLFGPVHSNDDIWIQQAGGGNNNRWPIFYEKVTTSGIFMNANTNSPLIGSGAPIDDIFRGGYAQEIVVSELPATADELQQMGISLGDPNTDIVYVKLNGSSFVSMYGEIVAVDTVEFDVYSWFPHDDQTANSIVNSGGNWFEDSDVVWTNEIVIYDTLWTDGVSGSIDDIAYWTEAELWIEGIVAGKITFGSAKNVFIVGDITYANTNPGDCPDGFSGIDPYTGQLQYEGTVNTSDFFGLVSEQKIKIKYKHRDPFNDNMLRDDNCSDIMLYGTFAALAEGDSAVYGDLACHYDGIFTFEYQHPHGSTPNFTALSPYTLEDTLYTFIDLHKYIYPEDQNVSPELAGFLLHGGNPLGGFLTCGFPYEDPDYINSYPNTNSPNYHYPYGTDYPWYNPVWPESQNDIVFERGTVHLFGGITQRRRGFMHRSGSDPYNHPPGEEGIWDLDNFHFDGIHPSTGYYKEYYYDRRLTANQPPHFPTHNTIESFPALKICKSDDGVNFSEIFNRTEGYDNFIQDKLLATAKNEILATLYKARYTFDLVYSLDSGDTFIIHELDVDGLPIDLEIFEDEILILTEADQEHKLYSFYPIYQELTLENNFTTNLDITDLVVTNNNRKIFANAIYNTPDPININFHYTDNNNNFTQNYIWNTPFDLNFMENSVLDVNVDQDDSVYVSFLNTIAENVSYGDLFFSKGSLPDLTFVSDEQLLFVQPNLMIYPNPFNPETTIKCNLTAEHIESAEIVIYNLKGQKIRELEIRNEKSGIASVIWDGTDRNSKKVSSGVYFFQLRVNDKPLAKRKAILLK